MHNHSMSIALSRPPLTRRLTCIVAFGALLPGPSAAESGAGSARMTARDFVPAVRMDVDRRAPIASYARQTKMPSREMAASGLVRCGEAVGTAQLTLRADVITTAAHVVIGPGGRPRQDCEFVSLGAPPVRLDMATVKTGSTQPLAEPATRDWAVARLVDPVPGVAPFSLSAPGAIAKAVMMCAAGFGLPGKVSVEHCRMRDVIKTAADGIREIAIDCNAAPGSSGAAVVYGRRIYGIYVGYRSADPQRAQAYSQVHYNFVISIDGPFRRALLAAARKR